MTRTTAWNGTAPALFPEPASPNLEKATMNPSISSTSSRRVRACVAALLLLCPSLALADDDQGAKLFEAGQQAYKLGDFKTAIDAFEQAFKIEARSGLLFSIGQAHRRQYAIDRRPGHVAVAIKHFRDYLSAAPSGARRSDATEALAQLEPLAKSLEVDGQLPSLPAEPPETRLVVSSPADGAMLSIDGGAKKPVPFIGELAPGKHTITVSAAGFGDEKRDIEVAEHAVTALDVPLAETPATIQVNGPSGARVAVDGKDEATLPLTAPLSIAAGEHVIHVALNGHETFLGRIDLPRAGTATVDATMPSTPQRRAAIGLLVGGATSFAAGIVLGGIAVGRYVSATDQKADIDAGKVVCRVGGCGPLDDYNTAVSDTRTFGIASGVFLGVGVLAAGTGVALFALDTPAPPDRGSSKKPGAAPSTPSSPDLEVSVGPSGIHLHGSF